MLCRTPTLICVGAQKAATTWLYDSLRRSNKVFLPPVKELHYFSQLYNSDASRYGPAHRLDQAGALLRHLEQLDTTTGQLGSLPAQAIHLMSDAVDDEWYRGIFAYAAPEQCCVEICPSYMNIPLAAVQHVDRVCPDAHFLILVRDPIERCWSHIRMHISRGIESRNLEGLASGQGSLWAYLFYTDYLNSVKRWESVAGDSRVTLILYDEILSDPASVLSNVLALGNVASANMEVSNDRKVFVGEEIGLPENLRRRLLSELEPQYQFLRDRFPEAVDRWLARHHRSLG